MGKPNNTVALHYGTKVFWMRGTKNKNSSRIVRIMSEKHFSHPSKLQETVSNKWAPAPENIAQWHEDSTSRCALHTSSERPHARLCAEDCCSDGRKICSRAMPNTIKILTSKNEGNWHTFQTSGWLGDTPTTRYPMTASPLYDPPSQIFVNPARETRWTWHLTVLTEPCRNNSAF